MDNNTLPLKLNIASPCPARWEDMGGSDQVRFCDHCRKNVYNLSAMTSYEATALLDAKKGQLCARFYRRADGTVLTEDCPVGIARYWRRVKTLVVGGATATVLVMINCAALTRGDNNSGYHSRGRLLVALDDATDKVKSWFGVVKPVVTVGMLPLPVTVPKVQSGSNLPMTGRIIVAHPTNSPVPPTPPVLPKK